MEKKYILLILFLLILLPIGNAINFNETSYTLDVDTSLQNVTDLKAQYVNGYWAVWYGHIGNIKVGGQNGEVGIFDYDFTRQDGFDAYCEGVDSPYRSSSLQVGISTSNHGITILNESNIDCYINWVSGGYRYIYSWNATLYPFDSDNFIVHYSESGVSLRDYELTATSSWNYPQLVDHMGIVRGYNNTFKYWYNDTEYGTLTSPSAVKIGNITLHYEPVWTHYILAGERVGYPSDKRIYAMYYDANPDNVFAYQNSYEAISTFNGSMANIIQIDRLLYLTYILNNTHVVIERLAPSEYQHCILGYCSWYPQLTKIDYQLVAIPEPVADSTSQVLTPFLAYDYIRKYLFYSVHGTVAGSLNTTAIKYIAESIDCNCDSWINETEAGFPKCYGDQVGRTRTCYPSACDVEFRTDYSTWCNQSLIGLPPIYRNETEVGICSIDNIDPETMGNPQCAVSLHINETCQKVYSTATLYLYVKKYGTSSCYGGNMFYEKICNPLTTCEYKTDTCDQVQTNTTFNVSYNNYGAGRTANALFELGNIGGCKGQIGFLKCGWQYASMKGVLTVTCEKLCGGKKTCYYVGSDVYSIDEQYDCSPNVTQIDNEHLCVYGCTRETGVCVGQEVTTSIPKDCMESDDAINCYIEEVNVLFEPTTLLIIAIGMIMASMVMTEIYVHNWQISIASGLLAAIIFWKLEWFDTVYLIMWGLTVALIWGNTLARKVQGD